MKETQTGQLHSLSFKHKNKHTHTKI